MGGTLNVDTSNLTSVGNSLNEVAATVNATYTNVKNTVNNVTAKESWKGEASDKFLEKFEALKPTLEEDLRQLTDLGPTIIGVADGYQSTEEENVGQINA